MGEREVKQEKQGHGVSAFTAGDLGAIEKGAKWLLSLLFGVVLIFSIGIALGAADCLQGIRLFLRSICVASVISLATATMGSVLGFLFGIPKLLQHAGDVQANKGERAEAPGTRTIPFFMTNTSLEEISDWLTKIIIGIGLVQFEKIISCIYVSASAASAFIEGKEINFVALVDGPVGGATSFFFSIIILCLFSSCLFMYLQTRTRLTLMFMKVEHSKASGQAYVDAFSAPVTSDDTVVENSHPSAKAVVQAPAVADKELLLIPREQLRTATEIAGWASAQARAGNTFVADFALRDALQIEPGNADIMLRLAEVFSIQGNHIAHVDLVRELIGKNPIPNKAVISVARTAQMEALYLPPPDGFTKSIELANYLERVDAGKLPSVQLRKACAFGQKFKFEKETMRLTNSAARDSALSAARRVIELEPNKDASVRIVLRQVYDPKRFGGPATDNDLEVFVGDPDFEKVIVEGAV